MNELDVQVICANSPEAKGRVERLFGTLQDRMIKEMRLRDLKEQDLANVYIYEKYMPDHNKRFSVPAKNPIDVHRLLTNDQKMRLQSIFSVQSRRKVNNDYTIQFKTKWFQLEATDGVAVYKRDEVIIEERLDDTIHIKLKEKYLKYRVIPGRPKRKDVNLPALTANKTPTIPPKNHPWRKFKI